MRLPYLPSLLLVVTILPVIIAEPDVFGDYFDDGMKLVDISQDAALRSCLSDGKTADKTKAAYDGCYGEGYDFDDLAKAGGDDDGLPDELEEKEGCFYKKMGWVSEDNVMDEAAIAADMEGLEKEIQDGFLSDVGTCKAWSGNFGERRKREAGMEAQAQDKEVVPGLMDTGRRAMGWVKKLVRNVRSPGKGQEKGKGVECKKKGKGGKCMNKKKKRNGGRSGGRRKKPVNKTKKSSGKPTSRRRRKKFDSRKPKNSVNKIGRRRTNNKEESGKKKQKKPAKRGKKGRRKSYRKKEKTPSGKGNKKPKRPGNDGDKKRRRNGTSRSNKKKNKDSKKSGNGMEEGDSKKRSGKKKNDKSMPESVYNKLWCIDLAIEQALEKCVEAKIQN